MSAFVVDNRTINQIIATLSWGRNLDHEKHLIKEETGCDLSLPDDQRKLAESMHALNINAVCQRYEDLTPKTATEAFNPDEPEFVFAQRSPATLIATYKLLQCWSYQCAEGNVPDTSLLYNTMERVSASLAGSIISKLPEYDAVSWG